MVTRVATVAFEGIEARAVDVQVQIVPGSVVFTVVGLPDKAVAESRERVRSALIASGLALPAKRITVNLAPADLPKEGSHFDLPIALGVMAAIGAIPADALAGYCVLGELALDGSITAVSGVLPAAVAAGARGLGLICPAATGPEAAWAGGDLDVLAPRSLIQLANHFKGSQVMARPEPAVAAPTGPLPDLADIRGQEGAKRALEIAAAGGHNLLMNGPPGSGKSMLAARLPSILPPLTPRELLDISMIQSVAGALKGGALSSRRPFRQPHHSASMAALVGGGLSLPANAATDLKTLRLAKPVSRDCAPVRRTLSTKLSAIPGLLLTTSLTALHTCQFHGILSTLRQPCDTKSCRGSPYGVALVQDVGASTGGLVVHPLDRRLRRSSGVLVESGNRSGT